LWGIFRPPFIFGYYPCGDLGFLLPPNPLTEVRSTKITEEGFASFTLVFPIGMDPNTLSIITPNGVTLFLYTKDLLFIPDYTVVYDVRRTSGDIREPLEILFYTSHPADPFISAMVDSDQHITLYPLVFNEAGRANGRFKIQQFDNLLVYFPYPGFTITLQVQAVVPEVVSCVIPTTEFLTLETGGCTYRFPVIDFLTDPVNIAKIPADQFEDLAAEIFTTYTLLERPVPQLLDSHPQLAATASTTLEAHGSFVPNASTGFTSLFIAGNVGIDGAAVDGAITNFRQGGVPPGFSVQPVDTTGKVIVPAPSSLIHLTLQGTSGSTGTISLQYFLNQFNLYDGGTEDFTLPSNGMLTLAFTLQQTGDVRVFLAGSQAPNPFTLMMEYPAPFKFLPSSYFTIMNPTTMTGRNEVGDLLINGTPVDGESGFKTKTDLSQFPLTYPFGSPFYTPGSIGYLGAFPTWNAFMKTIPSLDLTGFSPTFMANNVLVVETPNPLKLSQSIRVGGLVVRHGGILLIDDTIPLTIETPFILVESGGLLQAGNGYFKAQRYQGNLTIFLTNDDTNSQGIPVVSQYSTKVYFPGGPFPDQTGDKLREPYSGPPMMGNSMGGKCIAVGFNGSLSLSGQVPSSKPYQGTWGATTDQGAPFVDSSTLMTYFDGTQPDQKAEAVLQNIETDYPNTWCQLLPPARGGNYNIGDTTLLLKEDVSDWPVGSKIVITAQTDKYTSGFNATSPNTDINGLVPLWLDHDDPTNRAANLLANNSRQWPHQFGVEVGTIAAVQGQTITLKEGLRFVHNSNQTPVIRTINGVVTTILVDTFLHVGLLSRTITIRPQYNPSPLGTGCNDKIAPNSCAEVNHCLKCNYENTSNSPNKEIHQFCYVDRDADPKAAVKYCDNQTPQPAKGHWLFGSTNLTGCNAISGGQMIFRMGSSVRVDGVELKFMGLPANFGTIMQYSLHFHLAGYSKSFRGYLPSPNFPREALIANCANWCAYSRWVTVHGTHEVDVKNNIGFVSMGSGYFIEDGIEVNNTFEHNMGICTLPARFDTYYNPTPIYPNVASDLCFCSTYWFKNDKNRCFRNVACNSPQPVAAIWAVPQNIGKLRGPSVICLGDEDLGLPSLAGEDNALAFNGSYLSQNLNGNANGEVQRFSTNTPCWALDNLKASLLVGTDFCATCSVSNDKIPYLLFAENIFYQIAAGLSEFPEALAIPLPSFDGTNGVVGCGFLQLPKGQPQFMPGNGQNTCTDGGDVAQVQYFQTVWGAGKETYPFQPISPEELANLDDIGATTNQTSKSTNVPKIFSNFLSFNMGPSANGLWGGTGWTKQTPAWLLSCCFLKTGGGETYGVPGNPDLPNSGIAFSPDHPASSTLWSTVCGDNLNQYPNIYHVIYNHITDGTIGLPPNPTIFGGPKMFIGDSTRIYLVEYVVPNQTNQIISVANNYFLDNTWQNLPPTLWTQPKINKAGNVDDNSIYYGLFNFSDNTFATQHGLGAPVPKGSFANGQTNPSLISRKYPYVSGPDNKLLRGTGPFYDANPQWKGITINSQASTFINSYGIALGDRLCQFLSFIPKCSHGPWQLSGDSHPGFDFAPIMPPNCGILNLSHQPKIRLHILDDPESSIEDDDEELVDEGEFNDEGEPDDEEVDDSDEEV
jgi:hypothetical protein